MFPYHYGSYATSDDLFQTMLKEFVSIPLWFLRNAMLTTAFSNMRVTVSIPLWFLRNKQNTL